MVNFPSSQNVIPSNYKIDSAFSTTTPSLNTVEDFFKFFSKTDLATVLEHLNKGSFGINQLIGTKGMTPLMIAASLNNLDLIIPLIENGADGTARSLNGYSALEFSLLGCRKLRTTCNLEVLKHICTHFPTLLDQSENKTPILHIAALNAGEQEIEWLINEKRIPVDLKDEHGETALHKATIGARTEIAKKLIELGANPHEINHSSYNPASYAKFTFNDRINTYMKEFNDFCENYHGHLWKCVGCQKNDEGGLLLQYTPFPDIDDVKVNREISPAVEPDFDLSEGPLFEDIEKSKPYIKMKVERKIEEIFQAINTFQKKDEIDSYLDKLSRTQYHCNFEGIEDFIDNQVIPGDFVRNVYVENSNKDVREIKKILKNLSFENIHLPFKEEEVGSKKLFKDISKKLGFNYSLDEGGGYVMQIPDRLAFLNNYKKIQGEIPSLPGIDLAPSVGIASDKEFVEAFLYQGLVASDGRETVHDMLFHVHPTVKRIVCGDKEVSSAKCEKFTSSLRDAVKPIHEYLKNINNSKLKRKKAICQKILGAFIDFVTSRTDYTEKYYLDKTTSQFTLLYTFPRIFIGPSSDFANSFKLIDVTSNDEIWRAWKELVLLNLDKIDPAIPRVDLSSIDMASYDDKAFLEEFLNTDWFDKTKDNSKSEFRWRMLKKTLDISSDEERSKVEKQFNYIKKVVGPIHEYLKKTSNQLYRYKFDTCQTVLAFHIDWHISNVYGWRQTTYNYKPNDVESLEDYKNALLNEFPKRLKNNSYYCNIFKTKHPNDSPQNISIFWNQVVRANQKDIF